ncbi:MAG: glycosyltransferase family 4 protein [Nocardioidaceae bacterium]
MRQWTCSSVPADSWLEVMTRSGVAPDRLRVVSHFVDLLDVPQSSGTGTGFIFAGRLSPEKGVDTLIQAMAHVPEHVHLDVAGDGPMRTALERLAGELAPGRVVFHGRLATPQLQTLLARSIASVVPSRWYENQPMTILESFAASVPVVATDLGGMPELVRTELDGLVVPHADAAALARALTRLESDRSWAHRLGISAHARLEEHFSAGAHLEAVSEVYEYARQPSQAARAKRQRSR